MAKLAVYVIVGIAVAQGIVVVTVLLSVRKVLGRAFSSDPKIISYAASMIPIVACGNFLDGLQCVLSGSYCLHTRPYVSGTRKYWFRLLLAYIYICPVNPGLVWFRGC